MLRNFKTYDSWHSRLAQLIPDTCETRLTNLTLLIVGLYHAGSIHFSAIVRKWPIPAMETSLTRRLSRFLANPGVKVRAWYEPVARQLLAPFAGREVRLILDGSRVGFGHQLLMVAIAYRRRALPLAWCWVRGTRGNSTSEKQLALLAYVRGRMPENTRVLLVGDAEFGSVAVLRQLEAWSWQYVLRLKGTVLMQPGGAGPWRKLVRLVERRGVRYWWPGSRLTRQWAHPAHRLGYWAPGEDEPWLLATSLPDTRRALQAYRRRMWVEEMFGDLKGHGFDLEATHLRHFLRLSRLTLAVCYLYVWLLTFGSRIIKAGQRHRVDRRDRRDLSLFRIGWDTVERRLALDQMISVAFHPVLVPVSGS